MLRVESGNLRPGMALALPVYNPRTPNRVLLKSNYQLTAETIERLETLGIRAVWVRYPSLSFLSRFVSTEALARQGEVVQQITDTFGTLQQQSSAKLSYNAYTQTLAQMVNHLLSNPLSAVFLGDIMSAHGDDLMRHSSSVTYLSLLMGLKLEGYLIKQRRHIEPGRAKEVINLGLGAMLHDIGILQLEGEVRERYDKSGDETDAAWREHPWLGYEMVRGKIDASAATCVLNHHQRFDGSGYAGAKAPVLADRSIHVFARIVGLAEQFDRLCNPPHLPRQPVVWALSALLSPSMRAKFDPTVLHALLAVAPPYPPGSTVRLSDGQWAVVIDHTPEDPCRPQVQIIPDLAALADEDAPMGPTIDLSEHSAGLHVVEHSGQDVAELNFRRPVLSSEATLV